MNEKIKNDIIYNKINLIFVWDGMGDYFNFIIWFYFWLI